MRKNLNLGVIGIDHGHIFDMLNEMIKEGCNCNYFWTEGSPLTLKEFNKKYPNIKRVENKSDILIDNTIDMVLISSIPKDRAGLSIEVLNSGKDLVAKEIHNKSKYSKGNFIIVNSALMEPEGIEEELFGLEENSKIVKEGFFEKANNGTLFIDEIGDMPIQTQSKILRVLTDSSFYRVGSNNPVNIDVRLLCSSTENLEKLVDEGNFRMDLFHRLNVVSISLPSLSERIDDIENLINYFSKIYSPNTDTKISELIDYISTNYVNYDWPGNIRELRNIIERYYIIGGKSLENSEQIESGFNSKNVISMPLKNARKIFEKNYLESQIHRFNGNISKTASFIGMERSALHRKLKQLGISIDNKE